MKKRLRLRIFVRLPFGVPLHGQNRRAIHFRRYSFDDAIRRGRFNLQALPKPIGA